MADPTLDALLEQLAPAGAVRARKMFGGAGLYLEGVFFGLVAEGRLFFRVDAESLRDYESAGSEPFQPFPDKPSMRTYWEVPERVQADARALKTWTLRALRAAKERDLTPKRRATRSQVQKPSKRSTKRATKPPAKTSAMRLRSIANVGPVSRRWLQDVGVRTAEDLARKGSVPTFLAVRRRGHRATASLLYALEAALLDLRPDRLPEVVRANLRERAGL